MMFLEGIRVLDVSRVLAGPLAAQTLGDMGADVLKIERPGLGDDTRGWGPPFQGEMAAYYQSCNRNKTSLELDLKDEQDRLRLHKLVAVADVLIDNYPAKARHKLGLDSKTIHTINPSIVTMNVTGYRGDRAEMPGYDIMVQAESGLTGITGPTEANGYKTGVAIVDVLTGLLAANGILGGLLRKERTGEGADLSISLYQTALMSLINVATNYLVSGQPSKRWGNAHANIVPYQEFQLADRAVIIGTGNQKQFLNLCDVLGIENEEFRSSTNTDRINRREWALQILNDKLKLQGSEVLIAQLREVGVPCAPILLPHEAIVSAQKWDPDVLLALPHNTLGEIKLINTPLVGQGMRTKHLPPPLLGEAGLDTERKWLKS